MEELRRDGRVRDHRIAQLMERVEELEHQLSTPSDEVRNLDTENKRLKNLVTQLVGLLSKSEQMRHHLLELKHIDVLESEFYEFLKGA